MSVTSPLPQGPLTAATGRNATITVTAGMVTLSPTLKARIGGRARGDIQLPIRSLLGVQFSPAKLGFLGFIRLVTSGSPAELTRAQAQKDPYTVWFTRPAGGAFEVVHAELMQQIAGI